MRLGKPKSIERLNELRNALGHLEVSFAVLEKAAEFWADARRHGYPTAADPALDADVILAAQAFVEAARSGDQVVIATTNVGHLARFANAERWDLIR